MFRQPGWRPFATLAAAALAACADPAPTGPTGVGSSALADPGPPDPGPAPALPGIPTRPAVALTAQSVDAFLDWAANVPHAQLGQVVQQLASASQDDGVRAALTAKLQASQVVDLGRQVFAIAMLGELRNPSAVGALYARVMAPYTPPQPAMSPSCSTPVPGDQLVRAAAVQALATLASVSPAALSDLLTIAGSGPTRFMRMTAIDGYYYAAGGNAGAADALTNVVCQDERVFIGLPRKRHGMDGDAFEATTSAWMAANPQYAGVVPQHASAMPPQGPTPEPYTPPSAIGNGDFEVGSLALWSTSGTTGIVNGQAALAGAFSAQLGSTAPTIDSTIAQTFTVPNHVTSLTLTYNLHCPDTLTFDWFTVTLFDFATQQTFTVVPRTCTNNGATATASFSLANLNGHRVTLTATSHDDNYPGDATYAIVDGFAIH
jgi:hypothetical protein